MNAAVIALTANGSAFALRLAPLLDADVYVKPRFAAQLKRKYNNVKLLNDDFKLIIGKIFEDYDALIFVMACGIVVRTLAPYIKDKTKDPAVVVLDERGKFVISLLSGHIGGANKLAEYIAEIVGGTAVITTATDVNGVIAFDILAEENDCAIENISDLKYISSRLVNGGKVGLHSDLPLKGNVPENIVAENSENNEKNNYSAELVVISNRLCVDTKGKITLYIRPKNLIVGIGCKRGTTKEQIVAAIREFFIANNKSIHSLRVIATIDLKQDEQGLLEYCKERSIELSIIDRKSVKAVEGQYTASSFVQGITGVSSVAEPCAVLAGNNAKLICKKTVYKGITLALAEEEKVFNL